MPTKTKIEWTDYTSNPVLARPIGDKSVKTGWFCDKPDKDGGCLHCYAETINKRFGNKMLFSKSGRNKVELIVKEKETSELVKLNQSRPGSKVFVADMFDLFQPSISIDQLHRLFETFDACGDLTLQFLTKYPARMHHFIGERYNGEVPKHFWLGMSAATQEWFTKNFIQLTHIRGFRFLSLEPLLSEINIKNYLHLMNWVIVGGESGAGARPCDVTWIRSIVKQCKAAKVPVFVKQLGSLPHTHGEAPYIQDSKGGDINEWPEDLRIREFPR